MKKTGYEIIGMIKNGKAPKKIKKMIDNKIYNWDKDFSHYKNGVICIDLLMNLNDEFEIIEEPKVWKPKDGEEYWVIQCETVEKRFWNNDEYDIIAYSIGNCFKTKGQAEKTLEKLKIYTQLKRYAEEHNEEKIDWKNNKQQKWYIYYETIEKQIKVEGYPWSKHIGQIYFTSEALCKQAIQEIGEDNIKKLFE